MKKYRERNYWLTYRNCMTAEVLQFQQQAKTARQAIAIGYARTCDLTCDWLPIGCVWIDRPPRK